MRNQVFAAAVLLGLLAAGCGGSTQEALDEEATPPTVTETSDVAQAETPIGDEAEGESSEDLTLDEKAVLVIDRILTDEALRDNYCNQFFAFFDIGGEEMAVQSLVTMLQTNALEIMGAFPPEAEELVRERALKCYDLTE